MELNNSLAPGNYNNGTSSPVPPNSGQLADLLNRHVDTDMQRAKQFQRVLEQEAVCPPGHVQGSDAEKGYRLGWQPQARCSFAAAGVHASPVYAPPDVVYIGSHDHHLYALHAVDGTVLWRLPTGGSIGSSVVIHKDGTLYVGSDDGYLYAVRTGEPGFPPYQEFAGDFP